MILRPSYSPASYDEAGKAVWRRAILRFLRAVEHNLKERGFTVTETYFNAGGVAVSGDGHLLAFRPGRGGVEVNFSLGGPLAGAPGKVAGYVRWAEYAPERNPNYPVGKTGPNQWARPPLNALDFADLLARVADSTPQIVQEVA